MKSKIKGLDYEIKKPFNHRGSNITNRPNENHQKLDVNSIQEVGKSKNIYS